MAKYLFKVSTILPHEHSPNPPPGAKSKKYYSIHRQVKYPLIRSFYVKDFGTYNYAQAFSIALAIVEAGHELENAPDFNNPPSMRPNIPAPPPTSPPPPKRKGYYD